MVEKASSSPQDLPIGLKKTAVGRFLRVTRRRNGSVRAVELEGYSSARASDFADDPLFTDLLPALASSDPSIHPSIHYSFSFLRIVVFSRGHRNHITTRLTISILKKGSIT
jgi:hypothetical protein